MADTNVCALIGAELGVPDLASAEKFYNELWGLETVATGDGVCYLRATGPMHHVLVLHQRPKSELVCINFEAPGRAAVDALCAKVKDAGQTVVEEPAALSQPGGGYGFVFQEAEGRFMRIASDIARHSDTADECDRPRKTSHLVLSCTDVAKASEFFAGVLGFKVADKTERMIFMRCNADHHSIALVYADHSALHHISYEMPSIDGVMRGAGRLKDGGIDIAWGVGRHGPGNNVFSYFIEPSGSTIEYSAEIQQIDDSYKVGKPDDWTWPPGRIDQWGIALGPAEELKAASTAFPPASSAP